MPLLGMWYRGARLLEREFFPPVAIHPLCRVLVAWITYFMFLKGPLHVLMSTSSSSIGECRSGFVHIKFNGFHFYRSAILVRFLGQWQNFLPPSCDSTIFSGQLNLFNNGTLQFCPPPPPPPPPLFYRAIPEWKSPNTSRETDLLPRPCFNLNLK